MTEEDTASGPGERPVRGLQVGQWLLANNYLLTALELLVEAQEVGKEEEVENLKLFFSDTAKFPPEEIAKHDPADAVNLQKLAKEREERLAIVEYELRIAKEDLAQMHVSTSDSTELPPGRAADSRADSNSSDAEAVQPREPSSNDLPIKDRMQLNTAVRQYLAAQGYKLSALTFAEEAAHALPAGETSAEQDGLVGFLNGSRQCQAAVAAAEEAKEDREKLQQVAEEATSKVQDLQDMLESARHDVRTLQADIESQESKVAWLTQKLHEAERNENEARRAAREGGVAVPIAAPSVETAPVRLSGVASGDAEAVLGEVAAALPGMVSHVLINARKELVPLFSMLIEKLKDRSLREALAGSLFNLIKKPTAEQRQLICGAMAELAAKIGPARTAEELLPQCWEQVGHRHAERRVIVAEICGRLAALVSVDMRQSLLLSMLQQLAPDQEAAVQRAVATSLAALLPCLSDLFKYRTVEALLLALIQEGHSTVLDAVEKELLPALAAWVASSDLLLDAVVPSVLEAGLKVLQQSPLSAGTGEASSRGREPGLRVIGDYQQQQAGPLRLGKLLRKQIQAGQIFPAVEQMPYLHFVPSIDAETQSKFYDTSPALLKADCKVQGLLRIFKALLKPVQAHALSARPAWVPLSPPEGVLRAESTTSSTGLHDLQGLTDLKNVQVAQERVAPEKSGMTPEASVSDLRSAAGSDAANESVLEASTVASAVSFEDPLGALSQAAQPAEVQLQADHASGSAMADQPEPSGRTASGHFQSTAEQHQEQVEEGSWHATQAESAAFASWVDAEAPDEWPAMHWLLAKALPMIHEMLRMVPIQEQSEGFRRQLCMTIRAVCGAFGPEFAKSAIAPLFVASATLDAFQAQAAVPQHVARLVQSFVFEEIHSPGIGRACVLPQLLAAVLPCCGPGALADQLRLLTIESGDADAWALVHPQALGDAVRFAAAFPELQGQLLALQWELAGQHSAAARVAAAHLSAAVAPSLPHSLLKRQVLPVLVKLKDDAAVGVRLSTLESLATVWQLCAASPGLVDDVHRHLDALLAAGGHEVEVAFVASLGRRAKAATHAQLEFVLQKVLLLLASTHQRSTSGRSPDQLRALAMAILQALSSIAACEVSEATVSLHLLAALQALRREAELLEPVRREQLDRLTQHQAAATPSMVTPERANRPLPGPQGQARRQEMTSVSSDGRRPPLQRSPQSGAPGRSAAATDQKVDEGRRNGSLWGGKSMLRSMSGKSSTRPG